METQAKSFRKIETQTLTIEVFNASENSFGVKILNNTVSGCLYNIVSTGDNTLIENNTVIGSALVLGEGSSSQPR